MRPVAVAPLILLLLSAPADIASAQVPARVETPYTLIDAESRTYIEAGVETPLRGNGPLTGYGYFFVTRPHFLDEDLYLRLVIPPGYFISELIRDHWPSQDSAVGVGVSGGLWAESLVEFRGGRFEKEESFSGHSAGGTLAYYLRAPKIGGLLPLEGQIRANPKYVWYDRTNGTSRHFRLPENSAIYDGRRGGVVWAVFLRSSSPTPPWSCRCGTTATASMRGAATVSAAMTSMRSSSSSTSPNSSRARQRRGGRDPSQEGGPCPCSLHPSRLTRRRRSQVCEGTHAAE